MRAAFLNGLLDRRHRRDDAGAARFAALLTPQGKIIVDCIVAEAPAEDGGGFFLDCPRALAPDLVEKLNFYKLRAKVICRGPVGDARRAGGLGRHRRDRIRPGLSRSAPAGARPAHHAAAASREGRRRRSRRRTGRRAGAYEAHRIALGVPRGGLDFIYGDAFPHETDMDQLAGVDFDKGCYVGQEVVSRMEHRGTARNRIVPVTARAALRPTPAIPVMAGDKQVGTTGSVGGRPRARHAAPRPRRRRAAAGTPLIAGGVASSRASRTGRRFAWPGEKAAE